MYDGKITTILYYPHEKQGAYVTPASLTTIGANIFKNHKYLTSVTIGKNVTSIGSYAFAYDRALKEMHYPGTYDEWKKIGKGFSWARGTNFILFCSDWAVEINSGLEKVL